jgi:hypothetical protein
VPGLQRFVDDGYVVCATDYQGLGTPGQHQYMVNRTQALILIDLYGPETNDWEGHKVVLYGEEGTWFGKHTWGIRIDGDASRRADAAARKNGKGKPTSEAQQAALIDTGSDAGAFDTEA